jgi:hypothetical protein
MIIPPSRNAKTDKASTLISSSDRFWAQSVLLKLTVNHSETRSKNDLASVTTRFRQTLRILLPEFRKDTFVHLNQARRQTICEAF